MNIDEYEITRVQFGRNTPGLADRVGVKESATCVHVNVGGLP